MYYLDFVSPKNIPCLIATLHSKVWSLLASAAGRGRGRAPRPVAHCFRGLWVEHNRVNEPKPVAF